MIENTVKYMYIGNVLKMISNNFIPDTAEIYVNSDFMKNMVPVSGIKLYYDEDEPDESVFTLVTSKHAVTFKMGDNIIVSHTALPEKYIITVGDLRLMLRHLQNEGLLLFKGPSNGTECDVWIEYDICTHFERYIYDEDTNSLILFAPSFKEIKYNTINTDEFDIDDFREKVRERRLRSFGVKHKFDVKDEVRALRYAVNMEEKING